MMDGNLADMNTFENESPIQLTEQEKEDILLGIDTKLLEQTVIQKKRRSFAKRAKSEGALQYDNHSASTDSSAENTNSKIAQPTETINIQNQLTAALAIAENLHPGKLSRSPSLRRISVKPEEPTKRKFLKKKISEPVTPKLVFTFTNEDDQDMLGTSDDESTLEIRKNYSDPTLNQGISPSLAYQSLGIDHLLDKSDTVSVRSFQNETLGVQHLLDKMETASMRSYRSNHDIYDEEETEEIKQEKKQRFWDFFTMITSITYAILIIITGIVSYAGDLFMLNSFKSHYSEYFNLFLSIVGIIWLSWLVFDINHYIKMINGHGSENGLKLVEGEDGEFHIEISMATEKKKIPEYYGFSTGRHSGSFFLKIGAGVFCFGHLTHMGLTLARRATAYDGHNSTVIDLCSGGEVVFAHDVLYPVFSFLQLFVIYKFGNVIVNKNKALARFAFMHCISASLCFWMYTIKNETLDSYIEKYYNHKIAEQCDESNHDGHVFNAFSTISTHDDPLSCTKQNNSGHITITQGIQCVVNTHHWCLLTDPKSDDIFGVSDWFYPFSIEFSILVVAVWYIMWSHIGDINQHQHTMDFLPSGSLEDLNRADGHKEAMVLYADCSSSTKGMFFGLVLLVLTVLGCIIVVVIMDDCNMDEYILATIAVECTIFLIMIIASIALYTKIVILDVNPHPISQLDDMLLIICLPSFFMFGILQFIVALNNRETEDGHTDITRVLTIVKVIFYLIQVMIQTPLIVDGLRRCSNSMKFQERKAGRNTLMFLIVANLAVYIMDTLLLKANIYKIEVSFYSISVWTILSHITLPLCIFYRFHSAVALADIWSSAYKPSENH